MYAVVAHFDKETEMNIKKLWSDLSDRSISKYAEEIPDRRPHITIASYKDLDLDKFIPTYDEYYQSKPSVPLTLNVLGTFLNSSALFLTPTPSLKLLNFHKNHHKHFEMFNDNPNSLYLPGHWMPHCTIANRLTKDKLEEAFSFCSQSLKYIHAQIEEVAIITTVFENKSIVGAPTIHSIPLK